MTASPTATTRTRRPKAYSASSTPPTLKRIKRSEIAGIHEHAAALEMALAEVPFTILARSVPGIELMDQILAHAPIPVVELGGQYHVIGGFRAYQLAISCNVTEVTAVVHTRMSENEIKRQAADSVMAMIMTGAIGKDPDMHNNISRLMRVLGEIAPMARGPNQIDIVSRRTKARMMGVDRARLPPVNDEYEEYVKSLRFGNRSNGFE